MKRRISWVKWTDICKPKQEGGVGIRDIRLVNLSLLAKWRWKLLTNDDEVWKNLIVAKYGEHVLGNVRLETTLGSLNCPNGGRMCVAWMVMMDGLISL
jgi:hypothetical protein